MTDTIQVSENGEMIAVGLRGLISHTAVTGVTATGSEAAVEAEVTTDIVLLTADEM